MCYLTAPKHDYFMTMVLDIVSNICMYVIVKVGKYRRWVKLKYSRLTAEML